MLPILPEDPTSYIYSAGAGYSPEHVGQRRRKGIHRVEVEITSPEGKTEIFSTESYRGEIKIEDGSLRFPSASEQEADDQKAA